jgi:hypothetical protein
MNLLGYVFHFYTSSYVALLMASKIRVIDTDGERNGRWGRESISQAIWLLSNAAFRLRWVSQDEDFLANR